MYFVVFIILIRFFCLFVFGNFFVLLFLFVFVLVVYLSYLTWVHHSVFIQPTILPWWPELEIHKQLGITMIRSDCEVFVILRSEQQFFFGIYCELNIILCPRKKNGSRLFLDCFTPFTHTTKSCGKSLLVIISRVHFWLCVNSQSHCQESFLERIISNSSRV